MGDILHKHYTHIDKSADLVHEVKISEPKTGLISLSLLNDFNITKLSMKKWHLPHKALKFWRVTIKRMAYVTLLLPCQDRSSLGDDNV